jgi:hypothetical protein
MSKMGVCSLSSARWPALVLTVLAAGCGSESAASAPGPDAEKAPDSTSDVAQVDSSLETAPAPDAPPADVTIFEAAPSTSTLTVDVTGKGRVTSTPAGIDCVGTGAAPVSCSFEFPVGATVTLATAVDAKSYGVALSGACTSAPCSVKLDSPAKVRASFADRVCSKDGWCWQSPLPQGQTLRGLWGASADDAWAVGDYGTLLHWDGHVWTAPQPPGSVTSNDLYAVFGTATNDAWAVGATGTLLHYDGKLWSVAPESGLRTTQTLRAIWGSASGDYWAAGLSGTLLHYTGGGWSIATGSGSVTTAALYGMWGSAANDVWAVGATQVILHWDGKAWTVAMGGALTKGSLLAVHGASKGRVWAVGSGPTPRYKYDGTSWTADATTTDVSSGNAVFVTSAAAYQIGYSATASRAAAGKFDGSTWTSSDPGVGATTMNALWGTADDDVWAVGSYGAMVHWDGKKWSPAPLSAFSAPPVSNQAIWGSGPNDLWIVGGGGRARHFDGTAWTTSTTGTANALYAISGTQPANVVAVGAAGTLIRWDGMAWSAIPWSGTPSTATVFGVDFTSATSGWVVGSGGLLATFGTTLATPSTQSGVLTTNTLRGLAGTSANLNAVGTAATALHYAGLWSKTAPTFTEDLYGVSSPTATSAVAVGTAGRIARYNGTAWSVDVSPVTTTLWAVTALPTGQAWAAGASGTVLRYDAGAWTSQTTPTRNTLYGLWANTADDVWAVGDADTVLRRQP